MPEPVFDALGRRFVVRCADPGVEAHVRSLLGGLEVDSTTDAIGDGLAVLTADLSTHPASAVVPALMGTVNLWAVAAAEGKLLLHSGAVTDRNGAAALLCGPSGSGKSTLTAALVQHGLAYVTDEASCLDTDTLRMRPFRKPISLKPGSYPAMAHLAPAPGSVAERCSGEQWLVPPDALGGPELPGGPIFPTVLVFPTHTDGATLEIEPVRTAEAAYLLGSNSTHLWYAEGGSLPAVARLARRVPAFRVRYGRTEDAVATVEKLLAEGW